MFRRSKNNPQVLHLAVLLCFLGSCMKNMVQNTQLDELKKKQKEKREHNKAKSEFQHAMMNMLEDFR